MEAIRKQLVGATVMTSYNKRTYKVDEIDFNMSPRNTFSVQEVETSYVDYYKTKYDAKITDFNQPVLISIDKRTSMKFTLIPELCQATGLTDAMRANFNLMKEMGTITHADAKKRVQECRALIDSFSRNEKCKEEMEAWQMSIDSEPQILQGKKVDAGKMVMGKIGDGQR